MLASLIALRSTQVTAAPYSPNGVVFDGTADWLNKAEVFTGIADSKLWTVAFSLKLNALSVEQTILRMEVGTTLKVVVNTQADNTLRFFGRRASSTSVMVQAFSSIALTTGQWYAVLFSRTGTAIHLYVDDVDRLASSPTNADTIEINFNVANTGVGGRHTGANQLNGELADFWVGYGVYIDFSVEANRRKFFNSSHALVDKGTTGATPTGTAPILFLSGATADWHTNKGTGGGMTENGAITTSSSQPSGA